MQIRTRLALQFILICAAIMLLAFYYIHIQFKERLHDEFYASLRSKAFLTGEMLVGKVKDEKDINALTKPSNEHNPLSSENIAIYDNDNQLIYSFSDAKIQLNPQELNQVRNSKEKRFINDKFNSIGVLYKNKYGFEYIIVAESVFNSNQLSYLDTILMWVYLLSILLIAFGGWTFSGQALRPVSNVINEVDKILPSDMTHRLNQSNQKDEISRLVQTFNKLLDRIQQAFDNQKLFLSNISHELKNPLNAILSQVEVTLNKDRPLNEYKSVLSSVYEDVIELNDVSSKLMQLSKISSDGKNIKFEKFRIDEMFYQVKTSVLKNYEHQIIHINVSDLPDTEEKLFFNGNEQLIKTSITNILENAVKYGNQKPVTISLSIKDNLEIVIEDKGIGISQKDIGLIFEPFYRSTESVKIKGSGIGLSLVKSIFDLHGIKLNVRSEVGRGTIFNILFPQQDI